MFLEVILCHFILKHLVKFPEMYFFKSKFDISACKHKLILRLDNQKEDKIKHSNAVILNPSFSLALSRFLLTITTP